MTRIDLTPTPLQTTDLSLENVCKRLKRSAMYSFVFSLMTDVSFQTGVIAPLAVPSLVSDGGVRRTIVSTAHLMRDWSEIDTC